MSRYFGPYSILSHRVYGYEIFKNNPRKDNLERILAYHPNLTKYDIDVFNLFDEIEKDEIDNTLIRYGNMYGTMLTLLDDAHAAGKRGHLF